ncbi:hypothetical protein D3C80_2025050 [compost metagenome]
MDQPRFCYFIQGRQIMLQHLPDYLILCRQNHPQLPGVLQQCAKHSGERLPPCQRFCPCSLCEQPEPCPGNPVNQALIPAQLALNLSPLSG